MYHQLKLKIIEGTRSSNNSSCTANPRAKIICDHLLKKNSLQDDIVVAAVFLAGLEVGLEIWHGRKSCGSEVFKHEPCSLQPL